MSEGKNDDELIFGKNAVLAYLEQHNEEGDKSAQARVNKLFVAEGPHGDRRLERIRSLSRSLKIPLVESDRRKLDQMLGGGQIHQGVVAQISPAEFLTLESFLSSLSRQREDWQAAGHDDPFNTFVIAVLDGIEDPHNLGAIVRVGEAAGLKALLLPGRRSAGITGTVAKTSAGALATLPIVRVQNLSNTLSKLKEYGFWIAGLSLEARDFHFDVDLKRPLAIVIGSEGSGMGRLVEKNCDLLLKIPMLGKTESLNASVAAGIVFYEVVRQRLASIPKMPGARNKSQH
jgi:23S rRNA (guanosine2251-2'-O)-methyltransferase